MEPRIDELAQVAEGGYLASLEIFHLLHCLVRLETTLHDILH